MPTTEASWLSPQWTHPLANKDICVNALWEPCGAHTPVVGSEASSVPQLCPRKDSHDFRSRPWLVLWPGIRHLDSHCSWYFFVIISWNCSIFFVRNTFTSDHLITSYYHTSRLESCIWYLREVTVVWRQNLSPPNSRAPIELSLHNETF